MAWWTPPQARIQVKTEESEMEQSVEKIIEPNLLEVYNARDADACQTGIIGSVATSAQLLGLGRNRLHVRAAKARLRAAFHPSAKATDSGACGTKMSNP